MTSENEVLQNSVMDRKDSLKHRLSIDDISNDNIGYFF